MGVLKGLSGSVKFTSNTLAEVTKWSLDIKFNIADTTALGDSWKEGISTLGEWTSSIEGSLDKSDTNGQVALRTALLAGTSVTLNLYIDGTNYYGGTAYISSLKIDDTVEDVVKFSAEFQGSGAVSYN